MMSGISGPRILVINEIVNQNAIISASIPIFLFIILNKLKVDNWKSRVYSTFNFPLKKREAAPILPALLPNAAAMISVFTAQSEIA
jgi:hypothetical protein